MIIILDYNIIASGSTGNAVRIADIMFDCGVPFSKMKDDLYLVDTLLLTHVHADHVKESTLKQIKKQFPRVKVYGNFDVAYTFGDYLDKIIGIAPVDIGKKRIVYPYDGDHDVPVSYFFIDYKGLKLFYATDTHTVENPYNWKFDMVFCESNYDEDKLREMRKQYTTKRYDPIYGAIRHLSTQECKRFYYVNRKDKNTPLIELHKSKRFY